MIERFLMPRLANGKLPPVPFRYMCSHGHWHISRKQAAACNKRAAERTLKS